MTILSFRFRRREKGPHNVSAISRNFGMTSSESDRRSWCAYRLRMKGEQTLSDALGSPGFTLEAPKKGSSRSRLKLISLLAMPGLQSALLFRRWIDQRQVRFR